MARSSNRRVEETKAQLLACLARHADERGVTEPLPWRTIESEMGASIPRCRCALGKLESEGLVVRKHLFAPDGGQKANVFRLSRKANAASAPPAERPSPE
ncbi:hypothetical protein [Eggerthella timonensis]|uniref:hypothetical protein n=1 Tax=Eggerthella timonensis TaxID=1871008 RepID=UPI000C79222F|nr:hypothetical protein [Eggerthella timonensis]